MRVVVVVYLMVLAFLLGMMSEKVIAGARRDEIARRYERALAEWRAMQIRAEQAAVGATTRTRPPGTPRSELP
ncbi:MAG TPA: hypothetical protein VNM66_08065 [Thermodesulfobacteriota bacterium]|nr:hypothetical protein [Thermodesulfobacteriota bacterium]